MHGGHQASLEYTEATVQPKTASEEHLNKSRLIIETWTDRVSIKHNTLDKTETKEYIAFSPKLVINDNKNNNSSSQAIQSQPLQTTVKTLDNFLFIGDSRYQDVSSISQLGTNVKNVGVIGSGIGEWIDVANSGGRGTIQATTKFRTDVDITGSYSGISVQLGANSLGNGVNITISQMQSFIMALKKLHPNTPIFVNSCLPADEFSMVEMNAFNNGVKDFCYKTDDVYYIDISSDLVDANGYIKRQYTSDGLHLNSGEPENIFANNIKNGVLGESAVTSGVSTGSTRENFVTLFRKRKYRTNKNNILSATSWLFEILGKNDKTKNMVDTLKFLLYKATGNNYGTTELDSSIFDPSKYKSVYSDASSSSNGSGASKDFISFIVAMEGEGQRSGDNYVVSYNSLDGNWDVGPGVVVRFPDGSTRFTDIIGEPYIGQIVTSDQLWTMYNLEHKQTSDTLDAELATQGVTLTEYQRDAMLSFLFNCGDSYAKSIVSAYKNGGNEGFWNEIKGFVNSKNASNLPGLIRRREQEYELFTKGDYDYPY